IPVAVCEGAKEQIDRRPFSAGFIELSTRDLVVGDVQAPVGRDDIDVVGLQRDGLSDLEDRHTRALSENAGHLAALIRIEVYHHYERGAGLLGKRAKQGLQCLDTPGRGADADHDRLGAVHFRDCAPLLVIAFSHQRSHSLSVRRIAKLITNFAEKAEAARIIGTNGPEAGSPFWPFVESCMANRDILAIGTSAGGFDALRFLAGEFSRDFPASVVVAIHLSSQFRSALDAILTQAGPLPAKFAVDGD